jgi:hypothetical protein
LVTRARSIPTRGFPATGSASGNAGGLRLVPARRWLGTTCATSSPPSSGAGAREEPSVRSMKILRTS